MKRFITILSLVIVFSSMALSGCTGEPTEEAQGEASQEAESTQESSSAENAAPNKKASLTMLVYDTQFKYVTETDSITDAYQAVAPHITIEPEQVKDSGQLEEVLKIRNSAGELPDVMILKPYMLTDFSDVLAPLNETNAVITNKFASDFAIDGNVVAVPEAVLNDFIYYRKSIFEEYGLDIPTTWDEFIDVAKTIKEKGEYVPIGLGAKDAWADYPFNEYIPLLDSKNGALWNAMAEKDEPFSPGEPFYEAYAKIQRLYDEAVFGEDPLGVGFDQVKVRFYAKEVAMMAAGSWFLAGCLQDIDNPDDLGLFMMPVRDTKEEPFCAIAQADNFYCTPKDGQSLDECKNFIDWYFASDYYVDYLSDQRYISTVEGVTIDLPLFNEALDRQELQYVNYDGGNKTFKDITNAFGFDVKRLGQEMLAGKDLDEMMQELNANWKEARQSVVE